MLDYMQASYNFAWTRKEMLGISCWSMLLLTASLQASWLHCSLAEVDDQDDIQIDIPISNL